MRIAFKELNAIFWIRPLENNMTNNKKLPSGLRIPINHGTPDFDFCIYDEKNPNKYVFYKYENGILKKVSPYTSNYIHDFGNFDSHNKARKWNKEDFIAEFRVDMLIAVLNK